MTANKTKWGGVYTALVTPFQQGNLDFVSLRKLVRHQLDQGIEGFVVNGTTGESPTLSWSEVESLFQFVHSEVSGQVPLVLGTGSNSTATTIEKTQKAAKLKADAVLVVVPYYNKPPQRGLEKHFQAVAEKSDLPVILYNVPSRTVANMESQTVGRLSRLSRIEAIKDATGDMNVLAGLQKESRSDFAFLSGDDATCVEFCERGGHGVIAVASHIIGREMVSAVRDAKAGGKVTATYSQKYGGLFKSLYCEANPIPVKMALYWMGLLASPELRSPLVELDERFHKDLRACLKELGKI